jgi:hypothetical protein
MKRITVLLLLITMLIGTASAESIDVGTMSIEELIELHEIIRKELESRIDTSEPSLIGSGKYLVGTMLKPGTYRFVSMSSDRSDSKCVVNILADEDDSIFTAWYTGYITIGESAVLTLEDGNVLIVDSGSGRLTAFEPTWAQ